MGRTDAAWEMLLHCGAIRASLIFQIPIHIGAKQRTDDCCRPGDLSELGRKMPQSGIVAYCDSFIIYSF